MFSKFDKIPSLPVQDIKENPKCRGQRAITLTELASSSYVFIINVHRVDINVIARYEKFHHCLFKLLRKNQNVLFIY